MNHAHLEFANTCTYETSFKKNDSTNNTGNTMAACSSVFADGTLHHKLTEKGIKRVMIVGFSTLEGMQATVQDSLDLNYETLLDWQFLGHLSPPKYHAGQPDSVFEMYNCHEFNDLISPFRGSLSQQLLRVICSPSRTAVLTERPQPDDDRNGTGGASACLKGQ